MGKALRTLIIEDSETDTELLVRHLQRCGYDVFYERVQTAEGMRRALAQHPWEIVLSDYSMPRFDVMSALSILREHDADLPFIVVSGIVGDETAAGAIRAGAHDFFLKDRLGRLPSAIEREIADAKLRRENHLAAAKLKESERQLREAVRARDEFLSIASHELKTPLTPLALQLEAALELARASHEGGTSVPAAKLETRLAAAVKNVDRMAVLINHLLDVTRITSGHLAISPSRVDLGALVAEVVANMRDVARQSGSELLLDVEEPVTGTWDSAGLETVVTNLVSNAIKFGRGKPIQLRLGRDGNVAYLVVVDHGIGMASEAQQRIFERFERAVSAKQYGGLGIGLWISRQMVLAHGGTIRVVSKADVGSTFAVTLPMSMESAA